MQTSSDHITVTQLVLVDVGWSIVLDDHRSIDQRWLFDQVQLFILVLLCDTLTLLGLIHILPPSYLRACGHRCHDEICNLQFVVCNLQLIILSLILARIIFSRLHVVKSIMSRSPGDMTKLITETNMFFFQNQIFRNWNWDFATYLTQDGYDVYSPPSPRGQDSTSDSKSQPPPLKKGSWSNVW